MDEIQVENAEDFYKMAGTNQDKDFPLYVTART